MRNSRWRGWPEEMGPAWASDSDCDTDDLDLDSGSGNDGGGGQEDGMIEIEMEESSLDRHLQDSRCRCRINCAPHKQTAPPMQTSSKAGPYRKMLSSNDVNFVGYTYKNFQIVNDPEVPRIARLKKKNNKPKRPTIKSLFESSDTEDQPSDGSFLNLLPTQLEFPESLKPLPHSSISSEVSQARHR